MESIPLSHGEKAAPEKLSIVSQLKLKKIDFNERVFIRHQVTEPKELIKFIQEMQLPFEIECVFCQCLSEEDVLSEENEILLMSMVCITLLFSYANLTTYLLSIQETDEYFSPNVDRETLYEVLKMLHSTKYRVLVRNKGSGMRLLPKDSFVLFEVIELMIFTP